jgi:hypothetical protein
MEEEQEQYIEFDVTNAVAEYEWINQPVGKLNIANPPRYLTDMNITQIILYCIEEQRIHSPSIICHNHNPSIPLSIIFARVMAEINEKLNWENVFNSMDTMHTTILHNLDHSTFISILHEYRIFATERFKNYSNYLRSLKSEQLNSKICKMIYAGYHLLYHINHSIHTPNDLEIFLEYECNLYI